MQKLPCIARPSVLLRAPGKLCVVATVLGPEGQGDLQGLWPDRILSGLRPEGGPWPLIVWGHSLAPALGGWGLLGAQSLPRCPGNWGGVAHGGHRLHPHCRTSVWAAGTQSRAESQG